ncbi:MAG: hypothetical protein M3Y50_16925 [Acidobacteriota bacterium]|nr:hypothetical protein [Acidobacteriota bacterium]
MKKIFAAPCFLLAVLLCIPVLSRAEADAQTTTPPAPTPAPSAQDSPTPHGTILFKRDQDSTSTTDQPTQPQPAQPQTEHPLVTLTDAERNSLTFASYDLDVHLQPASSTISVHSTLAVKNTGTLPLERLALQISSALRWESFATESPAGMAPLNFVQQTIDTDADHTGKVSEAVISLPHPLAPGATMTLTSFYSGQIVASGNRLERIGAPPEQAAHADWDRISPELTALRGFGNVLWYPTAAAPVFLGDGARLFESVGQIRLRQQDSTIHLRLTVDYTGDAPDAAFFCGQRTQLTPVSENTNLPVAQSPGIATAEFPPQRLGFRSPSLFVTDRAGTVTGTGTVTSAGTVPNDAGLISAVTDHYDALPSYASAAQKVRPLLQDWIGAFPLTMLNLIDHEGQPFEDDALLVAPMRAAPAESLTAPLLHSLAHAWFRSSHVWLDEGVPQFMSLLWIEQNQGREAAVKQLQGAANTLTLAEPAVARDEPEDQGQSLIRARDEVYYRTKAAAVLWMLRSIVGDDAVKRALHLYQNEGKQDADPKAFQRVLERTAQRDLNWFFDDWVYRDRGLPDLTIASVTPRALESKGDTHSFLVAVEVRNDGGAAAEVPVTVRSGTLTATERLRIAGHSSASTRILFQGTPEEVIVNDGSVPEATASTHTRQLVSP